MHIDPELLALLSLGEPLQTEDDREHLATCPVCAAELVELSRVVELARGAAVLTLTEPDPRVWATIRRQVDARPAEEPSRPRQDRRARARLRPVQDAWSSATGEAELATDDQGRRLLQVSLHADLPSTGVRQAWLVHRDDPSVRQTLGVLDGPHGLWTVEHAIDLEQYAILEIAEQSIGGNDYSGRTIVRGELVPAA
jgi:hypothetical protein